ncbi:uroporphyrinogen-III synthase [Hyphomonas neptunium ATCC 15444]|uniref:Uroporphyrinogen-III synthase n=2 Tax=Hyphomonas TaxID=85 RepID=Q0BX91_HYPNA|nr:MULTISPECIES: uroporphyrinogen-III synthase [Hyphomonas]ABI78663.1 uroporphyrinogen-III synthase [Hyphomonas neptunium ATCC 15444]KCZ86903.1 uroporphyrinogen-III synthase [Hyphomonas hirschiana VP5]
MNLAVIVTRTQPGADETAARLTALGYHAILSPMLSILETGLAPAALEGVRDIIFTSANGVRAFGSARLPASGFTAWCVGPSTATAAREAGFDQVVEGDGDASDLARLILTARAELSGPLLHIANDAAAGHLVASLKAAGLDARFAAAYQTVAAPSLSAGALAALAEGPAILLIHSAKGAEALVQSGAALDRAAAIAISAPAAVPLEKTPLAGLWIAARPNEDALMAALEEAATSLRA